MAEVACEHSDQVIFTSDNPRSEDAAQIIKEMERVEYGSKEKIISLLIGKKQSRQQ